MSIYDLPAVNASLNGLSAIFLTLGFIFIKRGNKIAHRNCMISAFCHLDYFFELLPDLSRLSRLSFCIEARRDLKIQLWFRPIYLTILITHTILAIVIVPMILITLWRAKKERFELHKKIARWTWPLWMYVSVTGVIVYLLLYQIFPQK